MGVDFLYSSACCLVFVIQERMTGRGLHWLYAGIACQYPFLQLLFWCKEWAPSVQHTSHVPEHPETQSKLNASGVLKHHLQHLEIYFRAYTDLSRSYLFFSLKSRSFLFFFFLSNYVDLRSKSVGTSRNFGTGIWNLNPLHWMLLFFQWGTEFVLSTDVSRC